MYISEVSDTAVSEISGRGGLEEGAMRAPSTSLARAGFTTGAAGRGLLSTADELGGLGGSTTAARDTLLGGGVVEGGGEMGSLIVISDFSGLLNCSGSIDSLRLEEDILVRTSAGEMIVSGGAGFLFPSKPVFFKGLNSSLCSRAKFRSSSAVKPLDTVFGLSCKREIPFQYQS